MKMLNVIYGTKKQNTINKNDLYYKAYCRVLQDRNTDWLIKLKRIIFYGVKVINTLGKSDTLTPDEVEEDTEYYFNLANTIINFMALLTPVELINIFPIDKEYDGNKCETKDYFYSMDYLKGIGLDKPIGEEIMNLLWEYCNNDIRMFNVNVMSFMSNIRRLQGEPGIMEEWAAGNGIRTNTMFTDSSGKQYLHDGETGKTMKVKKPKPRYLKVIKRSC